MKPQMSILGSHTGSVSDYAMCKVVKAAISCRRSQLTCPTWQTIDPVQLPRDVVYESLQATRMCLHLPDFPTRTRKCAQFVKILGTKVCLTLAKRNGFGTEEDSFVHKSLHSTKTANSQLVRMMMVTTILGVQYCIL